MALYHKWGVKNGFNFALQFFKLISDSLGGVRNKLALPTFELVEILMEVWDAFVLTLNEIMVSTTRFLPLLNAFRFRLSKDLRYLRPRSLLALAAILLAAIVNFHSRFQKFQAWSINANFTIKLFNFLEHSV